MTRRGGVTLLLVSVCWASLVVAQAIPPRASDHPTRPTQDSPTQDSPNPERPKSRIGLNGLSISVQLGAKKTLPPPQPAYEMRDSVISDYIADQVIFVLQGNATDAARIARLAGVTIIETTWLDQAGVTMVVAQLAPGDTPLASKARLEKIAGVSWAQPNYQFQLLGRAAFPRRFALHKIPEAQPRVSGKIVMIDAPVDLAHENFAGANVVQATFGVVNTPALHGTAVAALLVGTGTYPGFAQGAHLTSLAAFGTSTTGASVSRTAYLARAMNEASRLRPDVLNLSFGGPQDRLLSLLLDAINKNGVCVAAAAGNGGPDGRVLFPATHPSSLAVTAVDERLNAYAFASRGGRVDIAGVGVGLSAAVPGGRRAVSGTSFATAVISGALLRMSACNGARTPDIMKQQVASFAQDLGAPGRDAVFGAGLFRLTPARSQR